MLRILNGLDKATDLRSSCSSSTSLSTSCHAEKKEKEEDGATSSESVPECTIDTCRGECQGTGWCKVATEFRNAIVPPIINKSHQMGCNCKKCNMKLIMKGY